MSAVVREEWKQKELESMARQAIADLPESTRPKAGMKRTLHFSEHQAEFFGIEQYHEIDGVYFVIKWDEG